MSNTQHLKGPVIPRGDMGLGFCLACLSALKQAAPDAAAGQAPQFAITMAPIVMPIPQAGAIGIIAVPSCFDHLIAGQQQQQRRPLLVAGGMS